jgi:adenylate cyclase
VEEIALGARLAREALISHRDEPTTIAFAAHALAWLGRDFDTALAAMERAIRLNPNSANIVTRSAWLRTWVLDPDPAISEFSRAIRLSPVDPEIGFSLGGLAYAFLMKSEHETALEYARRSAREMPRWLPAWTAVAVTAIRNDRLQEAQDAARRILQLSPSYTLASRINVFRDIWFHEMMADALRKAGLPE